MKWIFGSFSRDALFLIVPGLIALSFNQFNFLQGNAVYLLIALAFADSGHIYTTLWRTYFHPSERKHSTSMWIVPLAVALVFFAWASFKLPYLASVVIYAALLHNMKQFGEITRWYENLNSHPSKMTTFFSYALMILPVVGYHVRSTSSGGFYAPGDFIFFPNAEAYTFVLGAFAATVAAWVVFEIRTYRGEWNRVSSMVFSTALYAGCFFYGKNVAQAMVPLVLAHGCAYIALTSLTLQRTRPRYFATFAKSFGLLIATALIFGGLQRLGQIGLRPTTSFWQSALLTLYVAPLFTHFIYDLQLWKASHWESRLMYGLTSRRADVSPLPTSSSSTTSTERAS